MEARRGTNGQVTFQNTGDPLIDKWEREISAGLTPDLMEGLSSKRRKIEEKSIEKLKREGVKIAKEVGPSEGFSEDYDNQRLGLPVLGR